MPVRASGTARGRNSGRKKTVSLPRRLQSVHLFFLGSTVTKNMNIALFVQNSVSVYRGDPEVGANENSQRTLTGCSTSLEMFRAVKNEKSTVTRHMYSPGKVRTCR